MKTSMVRLTIIKGEACGAKHGVEERNNRGELFVDLVERYDMGIMGEFLQKRVIGRKWTWSSPDGAMKRKKTSLYQIRRLLTLLLSIEREHLNVMGKKNITKGKNLKKNAHRKISANKKLSLWKKWRNYSMKGKYYERS